MRRQGGFTLLELLTVVIILGIIAALALPQYFRTTERARVGQVLQLLASIRGAELRFRAQDPTNLYTTVLTNLDITAPATLPTGWANLAVTGTGAGSNTTVTRNGGTNNGALVIMDLDTGTLCASTAAAAADWNLSAAAC